MSKTNLKLLAAASLVLAVILVALQWRGTNTATDGSLLLPQLKSEINDISSLTVTRGGEPEPTVIRKAPENWVIASRDNYPADIARLRELLLALADAKIVEQKTSDPDRYAQLGLQDPEIEGSQSVRLQLDGAGQAYELIIGNTAVGSYRYVRLAGDPRSWVIDRNPSIPAATGAWLLKNVVDIKSADVRSAAIIHPDGEEIHIEKESAEATDFNVVDIPEGRELSYATVANGIAGVLNALTLDDVRRSEEWSADVVTSTFETFDGVRITVQTAKTEAASWIELSASSVNEEIDAVSAINDRVAGWQFKIPEYKANQLTRRWEDILQAESE